MCWYCVGIVCCGCVDVVGMYVVCSYYWVGDGGCGC